MNKDNRVKILITVLLVFAAGFLIGVIGNILELKTAYIVGLTALAVIAAVALFVWSYGEKKE
jgi:hypothetical protein